MGGRRVSWTCELDDAAPHARRSWISWIAGTVQTGFFIDVSAVPGGAKGTIVGSAGLPRRAFWHPLLAALPIAAQFFYYFALSKWSGRGEVVLPQ